MNFINCKEEDYPTISDGDKMKKDKTEKELHRINISTLRLIEG